jgi:hypothetical protein
MEKQSEEIPKKVGVLQVCSRKLSEFDDVNREFNFEAEAGRKI